MARESSQVTYQDIVGQITVSITKGDYVQTGKLPSERSLAEAFGVHRNTVRHALQALESQGLITTKDKKGSYINRLTAPQKNVLLLCSHSDASPELSRLREGFARTAVSAGFVVRRFDTDPEPEKALDVIPKLESLKDVAGAAIWPQNPSDPGALMEIAEMIPLALMDRRVTGLPADSVRFDDLAGGQLVTEHLLSQGHRRISFITDEVFAETVQNRWRGYAAGLEARGIKYEPQRCLFFHGLQEPTFSVMMKHLMSSPDRPTAIVCSNDLVAFTILRFLRDEGLRVPEDVAVTGYGNSMPNYTGAMALTSVEQPFSELGAAAARILISRVYQPCEARLRRPQDVVIPLALSVRGSSVGTVFHDSSLGAC